MLSWRALASNAPMGELAWLAGAGGFALALITFWMTLGSRISIAEEKAKTADHLAGAAIAKVELADQRAQEYRERIAAKVAGLEAITETTSRTLVQAEVRLAKSIEDVGAKIDHLSKTLIETLSDLVSRTK